MCCSGIISIEIDSRHCRHNFFSETRLLTALNKKKTSIHRSKKAFSCLDSISALMSSHINIHSLYIRARLVCHFQPAHKKRASGTPRKIRFRSFVILLFHPPPFQVCINFIMLKAMKDDDVAASTKNWRLHQHSRFV